MQAEQVVVFIHGLGDRPDAWKHQIEKLPTGFRSVTVEIPGLVADTSAIDPFSLSTASASILAELDRRGIENAHLCGLSLGAMIAFRIAADCPERARSLTLAAGQVKPPRALMAIQNAIMRVLPEKLVAPDGVSKKQMLNVVGAAATADLSGDLASIMTPTLVLCGSKDRANLPAARVLAAGIPDAELRIIDGAGHQSNIQEPERFSALLNDFLIRVA